VVGAASASGVLVRRSADRARALVCEPSAEPAGVWEVGVAASLFAFSLFSRRVASVRVRVSQFILVNLSERVCFRSGSARIFAAMADGNKRNIPIKLGDFSVIDSEFSNIRERFDAEMRKMEDEMTRFRSELMNRESNNFFKTTTR
jgi:hypothetical protein